MKKLNYSPFAAFCIVLSVFLMGTASMAQTKPADMKALKAVVQALENKFAEADNARDANAISQLYAEDAQSLACNKPTLVGRAAIKKEAEASLAKRAKGSTITFNVLDVYGSENVVTEVGTSTIKDISGKVTSTGKYMAVWEKRDGKYTIVRDIYNEDKPEK